MNYYAEWWEKARNSTGILTKPTYLKQLEVELQTLRTKVDETLNLQFALQRLQEQAKSFLIRVNTLEKEQKELKAKLAKYEQQ